MRKGNGTTQLTSKDPLKQGKPGYGLFSLEYTTGPSLVEDCCSFTDLGKKLLQPLHTLEHFFYFCPSTGLSGSYSSPGPSQLRESTSEACLSKSGCWESQQDSRRQRRSTTFYYMPDILSTDSNINGGDLSLIHWIKDL